MFANLLIILASSLVVTALFQRLRLPPVLGYPCVGLMIGPTALNWVKESEELPALAELLESSLMLASHALIMLGLPGQQVKDRVDQVRNDRYRLLHGFYPGADDDER